MERSGTERSYQKRPGTVVNPCSPGKSYIFSRHILLYDRKKLLGERVGRDSPRGWASGDTAAMRSGHHSKCSQHKIIAHHHRFRSWVHHDFTFTLIRIDHSAFHGMRTSVKALTSGNSCVIFLFAFFCLLCWCGCFGVVVPLCWIRKVWNA